VVPPISECTLACPARTAAPASLTRVPPGISRDNSNQGTPFLHLKVLHEGETQYLVVDVENAGVTDRGLLDDLLHCTGANPSAKKKR
jgi:hypothetical protein